jgi:hypothetical protein
VTPVMTVTRITSGKTQKIKPKHCNGNLSTVLGHNPKGQVPGFPLHRGCCLKHADSWASPVLRARGIISITLSERTGESTEIAWLVRVSKPFNPLSQDLREINQLERHHMTSASSSSHCHLFFLQGLLGSFLCMVIG